jgi:dCMP deaminase
MESQRKELKKVDNKTKQYHLDLMYMDIASRVGQQSYAVRSKVGAVIVNGNNILSYGYNGTPHGFDNTCEIDTDEGKVTKTEVLHAESNAIAKVAQSTQSSKNATLYVTMSPCIDCAKLIIQSGIKRVVYKHDYHKAEGKILLKSAGISVEEL